MLTWRATPALCKDKPKMYSISQAFHDKYVKNVTPPTWKEHLKTLKQKEHTILRRRKVWQPECGLPRLAKL